MTPEIELPYDRILSCAKIVNRKAYAKAEYDFLSRRVRSADKFFARLLQIIEEDGADSEACRHLLKEVEALGC